MIRLILGSSGSGKTARMIDEANQAYKNLHGHVVFVDKDDQQMLRLDHEIRLISMKQYHIDSAERLYGLLAGVMARDYDVERIFIDSVRGIVTLEEGQLESLMQLAEENNTDIVLALDRSREEIPEVEGVEIAD